MKLSLVLWFGSLFAPPQSDQVCLAATVYLEARDQSIIGQRAVAEVALRRLESGRYGRTLCEVVQQPGQFALTQVPGRYRLDDPAAFQTALAVAERVLADRGKPLAHREQVVPGAKYFVAYNSVSPNWLSGEPVATIGAHAFYRDAL